MNLHEYQGKELLRQFSVGVPAGGVASSAEQAKAVAQSIGGDEWFVKAQVLAGARASGHFKNAPASDGGVRHCKGEQAVFDHSNAMLGEVLFTIQTGIDGATVHQVYIEQHIEVAGESYVALLVDRRSGCISLLTSPDGGAFLEQNAASNPDSVTTWPINLVSGLSQDTAAAAALSLGFSGEAASNCVAALSHLYQLFIEKDCTLIEINPLANDHQGNFCALDATIKIDDNALFRQPELNALRDTRDLRDGELDALKFGYNYFKLDGDIGCVTSGAGMAMATIDTIKLYGGKPANFLDVPPVAEVDQFVEGLQLVLSDPAAKVMLVNIFGGGILQCDLVAKAILVALGKHKNTIPVVVRLAGSNAAEGLKLLRDSDMNFDFADDMIKAAQMAVATAEDDAQAGKNKVRASWWDRVRFSRNSDKN